jgi:hypothetical protein
MYAIVHVLANVRLIEGRTDRSLVDERHSRTATVIQYDSHTV